MLGKRHQQLLDRLDHQDEVLLRLLAENTELRDSLDKLLSELQSLHVRLSYNNRPKK